VNIVLQMNDPPAQQTGAQGQGQGGQQQKPQKKGI